MPIDTNDTTEGRTNNRRVDMNIISNEGGINGTDDLFSIINGTVEINDALDAREPIESFDNFQSIQQKPSNDVDVSPG